MRLIDADALYEEIAKLEAQALHMVEIHLHDEDLTDWVKWSAILNERTAFKHDVVDAPSIADEQMTNVIEYYRKKCRSYEETIFKLTNIINQLNQRMEEDDLQGEMKDDA